MIRWWLLVLLLFPFGASAAVAISEVAWMGDMESANHEWIELYNNGSAQLVDGWRLVDGANLDIELAGIIPADTFVVLERTSDASAQGSAFLVYTGALVNTGATLRLLRTDGSLEDQVSGGEDWENIGGDNTTKETAHYTSAGWMTAPATPGAPPPTVIEQDEDEPEEETDPALPAATTRKSKVNSGATVPLTIPDVTLALAVEAQDVGYVHQPITFAVEPSGIGEHLTDSLSYEWNFGDGEIAVSKDVTHVFRYPGRYVVTVYAGYKRQEQVARHEITILPVELSLTTNQAGDVQVNNDSPYELDLSGYRVKGEQEFTFPPRTIILPNQTVTIPRQRLGEQEVMMVAVYDTEAALVAARLPKREGNNVSTELLAVATPTPPPPAPLLVPTKHIEPVDNTFGFAEEEHDQPEAIQTITAPLMSSTTSQLAAASAVPKERPVAYVALASVMALGVLGVLAKPRSNEIT